MNDLTAFQRDILYVVEGRDDPHGLAIKTGLEEYYETDVNHGRLYPNLDQLVERGLVEKGEFDKRTNIYNLTGEGKEIIKKRRNWEEEHLNSA